MRSLRATRGFENANMIELQVESTSDVAAMRQDLVDELVAHAVEADPREACGVLCQPQCHPKQSSTALFGGQPGRPAHSRH